MQINYAQMKGIKPEIPEDSRGSKGFQRVPEGLSDLYLKIIQSHSLLLSPNNVLAASLHKTSSMLGLLTRRALILHGEKWTRTIFYEYLVQPGNYYGITRGGSKLHYIKSMIITIKGSISFKIVI